MSKYSDKKTFCYLSKDFIYLYENAKIVCSFDSDDYDICFNGLCQVSSTDKRNYFTYTPEKVGMKTLNVKIISKYFTKNETFFLDVRQVPMLVVNHNNNISIDYPESFGANFSIVNLGDIELNGKFVVKYGRLFKEFNFENLNKKDYMLKFNGIEFYKDINNIEYDLVYYDLNGKRYETSGVVNVYSNFNSTKSRILSYYTGFSILVEDNPLISVAIVAIITFILIVLIIRVAVLSKKKT